MFITDPDSGNFGGGSLVVSVTVGFQPNDHIGLFQDGNLALGAGGAVSVGGVVIGTASGGYLTSPSSSTLTITFNDDATLARVQTLLHGIFVRDPFVELRGGVREISIVLADGDGGSSAYTTQLGVTAFNDEPAGADKTLTIMEDVSHTFSAADFGFTDNSAADGDFGFSEGQNLQAVIITTLPSAGALTLNGIAVVAGQAVAAGDLPNLMFTPAPDASGTGHASFTFQVQDNGPTGGADQNTDQSPNTITFDVTAVNDAPVSTGFDNVTFTEGASYVLLDTGFNQVLTDVDSPNFDGGTLTIRVTGNKIATEDFLGLSTGGTSFLAASNGTISYHGVTFATYNTGGAGVDRVFTFNANATVEAVQTLMRNIVYFNGNQADPSTAQRTIDYVLTDGDGGTLNLSSTVNVVAVDDAAVAQADAFTIEEDGSIKAAISSPTTVRARTRMRTGRRWRSRR